MRVYLDACCLNRPFDDQSQERIRLETEAITLFIQMVRTGRHDWITSEAVEEELERMPDQERKMSVEALMKYKTERIVISDEAWALAQTYVSNGLPVIDSLHLAVAEISGCDILLTTDDSFLRKVSRLQLRVRVVNPAKWIAEVLE